MVGYSDARLHIVYLGTSDLRHSVELIQYLNPAGTPAAMPERHQVGASHLGVIVDDLDAFHRELSSRGVRFVSPPAIRPGAVYPMASKGCYMQDPDGNWLELLERPPGAGGHHAGLTPYGRFRHSEFRALLADIFRLVNLNFPRRIQHGDPRILDDFVVTVPYPICCRCR